MLVTAAVLVLVAVAWVAVLLSTDRVPRVGQSGSATLNASSTLLETIPVVIRPVMIKGEMKTPTWNQLADAYNLRDREAENQLEQYRRRYPDRVEGANVDTPIPEGAELALPIN